MPSPAKTGTGQLSCPVWISLGARASATGGLTGVSAAGTVGTVDTVGVVSGRASRTGGFTGVSGVGTTGVGFGSGM